MLIFHYESPEPGKWRLRVPALGLYAARVGTRSSARLFGRHCWTAAAEHALFRLAGVSYSRCGAVSCLMVGRVYVFRRVGDIRTLLPSLHF